jgi:hypothetical protein
MYMGSETSFMLFVFQLLIAWGKKEIVVQAAAPNPIKVATSIKGS